MKNGKLKIILAMFVIILFGSCRQASKYVDDVCDDIINFIKIRPPRPKIRDIPQEKDCSSCHGNGRIYDAYGYGYECTNCGGDGKVWIE